MKVAYQTAQAVVEAVINDPEQDPDMVKKATQAVVKARDPFLAIELAVGVPKANRKVLQDVVLAAQDARAAYMWAFTFPDADLKSLANIVKSNVYYGFEFERQFGSFDKPTRSNPKAARVATHTINDVPVVILDRMTIGGAKRALVRLPDGGRSWVYAKQLKRPE